MSDQDQSPIPDSHRDLLEQPVLAHLATIGPKGEPQSNPVWFDWHNEQLLIGMARATQKYRNLQREPRVAVSIVDPVIPTRYLETRGQVIAFEDPSESPRLRRIIRKYIGADEIPGAQVARVVAIIKPLRASRMG